MRKSIRDRSSDQQVKPRIMDYIRQDDGDEILEFKDGHRLRTIHLQDFMEQIEELRKIAQ